MKQKKLFILAAAAALFVGCSSDDSISEKAAKQAPQEVGFSVYVNRGVTRAGTIGEINDDATLQTSAGFGVFAYYTNNEPYDQIFRPNFMYNEGVTYDNTNKWTYSPIKYWPNEYTTANADEIDLVSFFAYAPYAESSTTGKPTGDATKGIAGFTRNTAAGDPMVKYIVSGNIGDQVDLLWGVCGTNNEWDSKGVYQGVAGLPWLNVRHPGAWSASTPQKLKFTFKHALAGLKVTVATSADVETSTTADPKTETKVFIRSIKFTGMTDKGSLNLNNVEANKAYWLDFVGMNDIDTDPGQSITWFDGRKDGAEGTTIATSEKNNFLNPNLIQSKVFDATGSGVKGTPANLFGKDSGSGMAAAENDDYVYVIPTGENVTCTIEYDVLTEDAMLSGFLNDFKNHGSVVKNVITKDITLSPSGNMKLENGKQYTINLYLGLKSVVFDATVAEWTTGTTGTGTLPANP